MESNYKLSGIYRDSFYIIRSNVSTDEVFYDVTVRRGQDITQWTSVDFDNLVDDIRRKIDKMIDKVK